MKILKPTMRENRRYLLVQGQDLRKNVERAVLDFIGALGYSKAGLEWIKENSDSAVISVNREAVNNVIASLTLFPKKIEVKRVSGTLKGLRKKN